MLGEIPLRFDEPVWLLLLLLLVPAFVLSLRSIGGQSRTKAGVTFALRALVITGLVAALAHPSWEKRGRGLTVTILLDRSQSIPPPLKRSSLDFLERAVKEKDRPEDRVAVITLNKSATITAMADPFAMVTVGSDEGDPTATNLAAGVRLALAIMPDDTANRILLVSDGNETVDSVRAAADLARANGVPIDVLPLKYEYDNEVIFERIVAPPRARQGQTARVRMVLRSQAEARGTIRLKMNGETLDLNGDEEGEGLRITLPPGTTALEQVISLDESGPHQFDAVFIPDDPAMDAIDRNNTAVAVTFVGGRGKVLIVDDGTAASEHLLRALRESGITVDRLAPDDLGGGLVQLAGYDAVILANIPRWAFDQVQDRMLHAYVHDLGGGLIMLGGPESFGAGGWIDSDLARALPVKLNPPDTRQTPSGALALVMHSCEMPQGNYWGQVVAQSAIEALSRLDYVGIVEFNWGAQGGIQGCSWAFEMQRVGDKTAALTATKKMVVGDMPSFGPSMQLALNGLMGTRAAQRHTIIISDGDPSPPSPKLLQDFIDNRVTVTTVMVGGHGTNIDKSRMKQVATKTGGQFYNVKNPKNLPQIFIKEARIVSRSLIQDGDTFLPQVLGDFSGPVQGFRSVPVIDGYVLTAPRAGLAQTPVIIATVDGNDPLIAHWNYGLGRSVAFTSDASGLWGAAWVSWDRFRAFWEQSMRWVMRPSAPTNVHVSTRFEGDFAILEFEALDADASFLNFLRTSAIVLRPDATSERLPLQQTGPGRYHGRFRTDEAGAYLVNIAYESLLGDDRQQGNLQAAITVPYAREFATVKDNEALLRDLATMTGGRVLAGSDPLLVDLFAREQLEVPKTLKRVWDLLAIIAASILLLDVAARRIAFDPARARVLARRAVGRRADVTTETVAAWKRTRANVSHPRRGGKVAADDPASPRSRFEATEADAATAIDVGLAGAADPRAKATGPRRAEPEPSGAPDEPGEGSSMSRLLAARRRARGDDDGGGRDQDAGSEA